MTYYLLKPCRTATAFISTLKKPRRFPLENAAEKPKGPGPPPPPRGPRPPGPRPRDRRDGPHGRLLDSERRGPSRHPVREGPRAGHRRGRPVAVPLHGVRGGGRRAHQG